MNSLTAVGANLLNFGQAMEAVLLTFIVLCVLFAFWRGVGLVGDWLGRAFPDFLEPGEDE